MTDKIYESAMNDAMQYAMESNRLFDLAKTNSTLLTKAWYYRGQAVGIHQMLTKLNFKHTGMQCLTELLTTQV